MPSRRDFIKIGAAGGVGFYFSARLGPVRLFAAPLSGGSLDPSVIPKYTRRLIVPPAMPRSARLANQRPRSTNYYEIAVRQFRQQILPPGLPTTTVWSYGAADLPGTVFEGGSFHYPALTIEARYRRPARVTWINDLVDPNGNYLPHLLPIDQTLHWANPPGGVVGRDSRGTDVAPYAGPVPIVTHVHGAHVHEHSDGYPEAWFLPSAANIPYGYATVGSFYDTFAARAAAATGPWQPGTATFEYPNDQRATTLWYHDHTLGMTRANVYAGPAGFYLLRGGPGDVVVDTTTGTPAVLPGPAPAFGDAPGTLYYEIPIAVQDRSFNADGSLFYPDTREFFDGARKKYYVGSRSGDLPPIWNPEFFGNTMVVNGRTWPYLDVEQRRYRFRFLNGCNSRFLILRADHPGVTFWQIGAEGGFLPSPVPLQELLMAPAERADVIVDFTHIPAGTAITLLNFGPDEPFGGGQPGIDFAPSDLDTTGQVMQFRVVGATSADLSTPPAHLGLPAHHPLGAPDARRQLSLNEEMSAVWDGPKAALMGTVDQFGLPIPRAWMDDITEMPAVGATEVWEFHNFTEDAHPVHIHQTMFEVLEREGEDGIRPAESWERGLKDTVIAYPGEITRVKAVFDLPGLYVWHCHIVEHEDNEMMRPFRVG